MSKQTPTSSRDQLLDQLVAELPATKPRFHVYPLLMVWIGVAWVFTVVMTLMQAPLRNGWADQLSSSPQFLLEMLVGFFAIVLVALVGFQKAVPGLSRRVLWSATIALAVLWLGMLFAETILPPFEASMAGKRAHCYLEVVGYSIPLMLLGFFFAKKGFVLNWPITGLYIGLASGFVPALLMQIACMYNPTHALECHILPAVFVGLLGAGLGSVMGKVVGQRS